MVRALEDDDVVLSGVLSGDLDGGLDRLGSRVPQEERVQVRRRHAVEKSVDWSKKKSAKRQIG